MIRFRWKTLQFRIQRRTFYLNGIFLLHTYTKQYTDLLIEVIDTVITSKRFIFMYFLYLKFKIYELTFLTIFFMVTVLLTFQCNVFMHAWYLIKGAPLRETIFSQNMYIILISIVKLSSIFIHLSYCIAYNEIFVFLTIMFSMYNKQI